MRKKYATINLNPAAIKNFKNNTKNLVQKNIIYLIKNNMLFVFLTISLLVGLILGSIFAKNADADFIDKIDFLFSSNYSLRSSEPLIDIFSSSIVSTFLFVLLAILFGVSMWGIVAVPILVFFRGFGIGISSGYLYMCYGIKGILFNLVVILPGLFISSVAIVIASKEAIKFSKVLAMSGINIKKHPNRTPRVRLFLKNNIKIFIIVAISAILDVTFSYCFARFFDL